jgi:hypothetical protein
MASATALKRDDKFFYSSPVSLVDRIGRPVDRAIVDQDDSVLGVQTPQ